MGRDYDAAVMSSGFCGFMLGTTANAMANMGVLTEKYGPAPRAYLVVPMVGAFFIDFTNAVIITAFLNVFSRGCCAAPPNPRSFRPSESGSARSPLPVAGCVAAWLDRGLPVPRDLADSSCQRSTRTPSAAAHFST